MGYLLVILAALAVAGSGVLGLVSRAKASQEVPKRQLVASVFRLVAGLALVEFFILTR